MPRWAEVEASIKDQGHELHRLTVDAVATSNGGIQGHFYLAGSDCGGQIEEDETGVDVDERLLAPCPETVWVSDEWGVGLVR